MEKKEEEGLLATRSHQECQALRPCLVDSLSTSLTHCTNTTHTLHGRPDPRQIFGRVLVLVEGGLGQLLTLDLHLLTLDIRPSKISKSMLFTLTFHNIYHNRLKKQVLSHRCPGGKFCLVRMINNECTKIKDNIMGSH